MDQFWEWIGRADALIGVAQFMICVVAGTWIGTAPKARTRTLDRVHAAKEYIPISELKGMDRIRAEIADFIIRPEQSVFVGFAGILFGLSFPIGLCGSRLDRVKP